MARKGGADIPSQPGVRDVLHTPSQFVDGDPVQVNRTHLMAEDNGILGLACVPSWHWNFARIPSWPC